MPSVLLQIENGIGAIRLNRPEKLNSFNREMALLLQTILDHCASSPQVRSVYITGEGKAFCAGQDLTEISGPNAAGTQKILAEQLNPIVRKIRSLPKPVVAAVNGVAAGAGANIALSCDIVVAAEGASFVQAFSKIGLIPDSGGTYLLPRLVGWQRASAMMMLSERIPGPEAARWGMIYKTFADDEFSRSSLELAARLAKMPTKALGLTKEALHRSFHNSWDEQLMLEDELQQEAASTMDHQEAVKAFFEKREPRFSGE
jgi:2-(1,2-epoxy-1,2-dihydrophenyl)acetyl-CoA isomerase